MGHFTTNFAQNLLTFFLISLNRTRLISKTDSSVDNSTLAPLSARQEYLLTPKCMTSQVVQSAGPLSGQSRPFAS